MREILFRGKRVDYDEWMYGYFVKCENLTNEDEFWITEYSIDGLSLRVVPETIGQYTGLTDKNGKKIFEGDIVLNKEGTPYEVAFIEEYARFAFKRKGVVFGWFNPKFAEIIGNIYDNPELMGVKV